MNSHFLIWLMAVVVIAAAGMVAADIIPYDDYNFKDYYNIYNVPFINGTLSVFREINGTLSWNNLTNLPNQIKNNYTNQSYYWGSCSRGTNCLTTSDIADSYVLNTGDTMTGALTIYEQNSADLYVQSYGVDSHATVHMKNDAQDWSFQVFGYDDSFRVKDMTNVLIPFRIEKGSPTDSLRVTSSGMVFSNTGIKLGVIPDTSGKVELYSSGSAKFADGAVNIDTSGNFDTAGNITMTSGTNKVEMYFEGSDFVIEKVS